MFIWCVRKVSKEAFKILNQFPFREQHVHHNYTFSEYVYIMCNKDMTLYFEKTLPKKAKVLAKLAKQCFIYFGTF